MQADLCLCYSHMTQSRFYYDVAISFGSVNLVNTFM